MESAGLVVDVELRNVSKKFGEFVAVDDISFQVEKGSFFSLLGPSGCGKTTTLRMIAGFEEPTSGELYVGGELMSGVPPFRRPTNLIFQHLALFPHMNVYENIAFGLRMSKTPTNEIQKRVTEILAILHLPGLEKRKIKELSGGQQQRVAIARALVNQPTVLLLDEPLGPLDLKLREEMVMELKRIQREVGTTFVYVTHDQGEALTMSNKIAVMNEGKIEQIGSPDEIYERPNTAFVASFIGRSNVIKGRYVDGAIDVDGLGRIGISSEMENGSSVLVSVKPEKVVLGRELPELDNAFRATVRDVYYQGPNTSYKVELENGLVLSVLVQNLHGTELFSQDEHVKVGWNKEDSIAMAF